MLVLLRQDLPVLDAAWHPLAALEVLSLRLVNVFCRWHVVDGFALGLGSDFAERLQKPDVAEALVQRVVLPGARL